jgi:hypothetical protein
MKCAAFDCHLTAPNTLVRLCGTGWGGGYSDILDFFRKTGSCTGPATPITGCPKPIREAISLRNAAEEIVVIIERKRSAEKVIAKSIFFPPRCWYTTKPIYLHESVQYHVDRLDWSAGKHT